MTVSILNTEQQMCFQFKASFLPYTVLQILHYDLDHLAEQLMTSIRRAPNFFMGSPVIVDLDKINTVDTIQFAKLKQILHNNGLIPIGVRGGNEVQHTAALKDGFPMVVVTKLSATETNKKSAVTNFAKLVTHPIRSGMQVYAKESDLIVTAAVSPGAELFADGNIHVYGPLRGRALAGVQGNIQARIFCRTLEAELVSIAGYYLTKENIQNFSIPDGTMQIYLENLQIRIEAI